MNRSRPQDRIPLGGDGRVTWGLENVHAAMVGRAVRNAREGIGSDSTDPSFVIRREAQLLISYADSPIVGSDGGGRAPDARGLTRQAVSDPMRLYTLLGRDHTTLLHADNAAGADDVAGLEAAADCGAGRARADGRLPGRGTGRGRGRYRAAPDPRRRW